MKKWKTLESEELFSSKIFSLRADRCELPDGRVMPRYFVMDFPDWVHVVPVTENGQLVTLVQYRHAAGEAFWEVPGGTSDPHTEESMQQAAARELREETGYVSSDWIHLGDHYPNPATQSNRMHTFLALNCRLEAEQELDPYEDLEVRLEPIEAVWEKMDRGEVKHSLMLASLTLARAYLRQRAPK